MTHKQILPLLTAFVLLFTACKHSDNFTIEGVIDNPISQKIFLAQIQGNQTNPVDTAQLGKDGKFKFSREVDQPGVYKVLTEGFDADMVARKGTTVFIQANAKDTSMNYTLYGSEENKELQKLMKFRNDAMKQMRSLMDRFKSVSTKADSAAAYEESRRIQNTFYSKTLDFVKANKDNFVGLYAVNYLSTDRDFQVFEDVANSAGRIYKGNPVADTLVAFVGREKRTAIGQPAPEINLAGPDGAYHKLSSLKGKYVMIDFWASWCGPCRQENPDNLALYNQYKGKGFTIFGVSLDKDKASWVKAIQDDKLDWTQVSELKYWDSEVVSLYDFQSIPHNILLDKEGKIIAKNLHGPDLKDFLQKLFN